jgi:hypothetical protein
MDYNAKGIPVKSHMYETLKYKREALMSQRAPVRNAERSMVPRLDLDSFDA